jgi:hypothetical protein
MFVSGVMFGNIQANEIGKTNTSASIIGFFKRFLLQYFVLTMPNVGKTILHGAPAWAALLLTSDITYWGSGLAHHAEGYWYIHCLFHILLIFIVMHAIFKRMLPGKKAVFATLFVCCGLGLVGRDLVPYLMDPAFHSVDPSYMSQKYSWPLSHKYSLFYYSPMIHIATFAIAALSTMVTGVRKLFLAGVFICYTLASFGGQGEFTTVSLLAGGLWIMFAPKTPVPRAIVPLVYNVAGASMFIYLLHFHFLHFTEHWSIRPPVAFVWAGGIALGVAAWRLWNLGEQILPQMFGRIGAWRRFRGRLNLKMGSRPGSPPPPTLGGMA